MPKLTETTKDQLAQKRRGRPPKNPVNAGNGTLHVNHTEQIVNVIPQNPQPFHLVAPHEPIKGEPFQLPSGQQFIQAIPVGTTFIPTKPIAPSAEPQILKVAVIGTAPSSRMLAPFNDPSWKIWACSPGNMNALPRVDEWFEIHGTLLWPENNHFGPGYIKFLSELKIPVWMQDQRYFPHAKSYPLQEILKEFGNHAFTSSFSWMVAKAMMDGAKEIGLYGVDMASRDEYVLQRQAIYHFFDVEAPKRGIKITIPNESDLAQRPPLYGFSEVTPFYRKVLARKQELKERVNNINNEIAKVDAQGNNLRSQKTYLEGALEDVDYFDSIWGGVQNNPSAT